jgi:hypothetical protein
LDYCRVGLVWMLCPSPPMRSPSPTLTLPIPTRSTSMGNLRLLL